MKKALILVVVMVLALGLVFAGCSTEELTDQEELVVEEEETEEEAVAEWSVTINDVVLSAADAAELEVVTQTLQKQDKEGNLKEQECTGYALADLLAYAEASDYAAVTVTAADGYAYELDAETAQLATTMLVINQDGEDYETPRLAVDGEGSNAWVKDVATITAE